MLRRLFFCTAFVQVGAAAASGLRAQDEAAVRILERQVRLTLDESGEYRVIEAMRVRFEPAESGPVTASAPLPLIVLQDEALGARGLGGDVPPRRVIREENRLAIVGSIPQSPFEVAVTYQLPRDATLLALSSAAPVDELAVFVDRGRIEVRPDRAFVREEDVGPASQPSFSYVARDVPIGGTLHLGLVSDRTGWRERFGVLIATALAAAVAGIWAWRRGN
jgi:hypothetical protein